MLLDSHSKSRSDLRLSPAACSWLRFCSRMSPFFSRRGDCAGGGFGLPSAGQQPPLRSSSAAAASSSAAASSASSPPRPHLPQRCGQRQRQGGQEQAQAHGRQSHRDGGEPGPEGRSLRRRHPVPSFALEVVGQRLACGFEYGGGCRAQRLVVTPLTERCAVALVTTFAGEYSFRIQIQNSALRCAAPPTTYSLTHSLTRQSG